ncbi:hypothetical protein EDB84DRAFT_1651010, partial [Lactarius hengduanensis]
FEHVLGCARAVFAYDSVSLQVPSWSSEYQFKPSSARCEQLVAEHGSRDMYGLREMSHAVASNATTIPDNSSLPSYSTPDSDLPLSLISPSVSESQYTQAPSVTLDQPEPMYMLSTTLLPSASFPTPFHTSSLTHSAADETPEILSTFPSPSITPVPFSIRMSDFEYLPSATVDQPAPTLLSTPPSLSSISSTFLPSPAHLATEDQPEPESASTPPISPSSPILLSAPSLPSPSTDDVCEIASMTCCSYEVPPTNFECLPSTMNYQPEFEPEHASLSSITLTPSLSVPSLALEFADNVPELSSSFPTSQSASLASSTPPLPSGQSFELLPFELRALAQSSACEHGSSTSSSTVNVALLSSESPEFSESESSQGKPIPFLLASPEAPLNTPISPHSTPPQRPPGLKMIGSVSTQLKVTPSPVSPTVPLIPQQVTTAQWLLHLDPQLPRQEVSLAYEVLSIKPPALTPRPSFFHSSGLLRRTPAHFGFALALVTTAILSSLLFNASMTLSTHSCKFWSKYEDLGNNQIGTLNTSSRDIFAQQL